MNWESADWTWWRGEPVFECSARLPGRLTLRHRPADGGYLLDGQLVTREGLGAVVTARSVLGWGPVSAGRDSLVRLYGVTVTAQEASAIAGEPVPPELRLRELPPSLLLRARALSEREMMTA